MVQVSYPGVYIQEKPSGVRTITSVATSIAAFVGSFPRGLLNEAVQCLSYADFEREFGGIDAPTARPATASSSSQNGGNECLVVRVATLGEPSTRRGALRLVGRAARARRVACRRAAGARPSGGDRPASHVVLREGTAIYARAGPRH